MKIRYQKSDLLSATEKVIIHGCNAKGKMNSGVAKAIRARYPKAFEDYSAHYHERGLAMGEIVWSWGEPHVVGNAITQSHYGRDSTKRYASYDAIASVIEECDNFCAAAAGTVSAIAMPFIGAGLANANWNIISEIIEAYSSKFEPVVYYLPEFLPSDLDPDLFERLLDE